MINVEITLDQVLDAFDHNDILEELINEKEYDIRRLILHIVENHTLEGTIKMVVELKNQTVYESEINNEKLIKETS